MLWKCVKISIATKYTYIEPLDYSRLTKRLLKNGKSHFFVSEMMSSQQIFDNQQLLN